jgi:ribosomal protein L15
MFGRGMGKGFRRGMGKRMGRGMGFGRRFGYFSYEGLTPEQKELLKSRIKEELAYLEQRKKILEEQLNKLEEKNL